MRVLRHLPILLLAAACGKAPAPASDAVAVTGAESPSPYLFVWGGDGDKKVNDWLTVLDANPASPTYGHIVSSLDVGSARNMPHHTEQEFPADGQLMAIGWRTGKTFQFDLRDPKAPKKTGEWGAIGGFAYPHSIIRLANGHSLATFQGNGTEWVSPGALVEFENGGKVVRTASAMGAGLASNNAMPYSLVADEKKDRVLTTISPMSPPSWFDTGAPANFNEDEGPDATSLQLWSLSALKPLKKIDLPTPPGTHYNRWPAEPRLLPDGSALVNTFKCGLFHVTGLDTDAPKATLVYQFAKLTKWYNLCSVPAVIGSWWVQPVVETNSLVTLDIRDPDHPKEVSRLPMPAGLDMPHWLAPDPKGSRVIVTGDDMGYVLMVNVDRGTGALSVDTTFKDDRTGKPGVSLDGRTWPHGAVKMAHLHGTLFGPR